MKIVTIDPRKELIIRSLTIDTKADAARLADLTRKDEEDRGQLDRIIIAGGTVRIMDPADPIPVPMKVPEGRYAKGNVF